MSFSSSSSPPPPPPPPLPAPTMSRNGLVVVRKKKKKNEKDDTTNRDRGDRDDDSEESDITMTQALTTNHPPGGNSNINSHNSHHQYSYQNWLTARSSRPQSLSSSTVQKQQQQQRQQKTKQKKIQQQQHFHHHRHQTYKQDRVSGNKPNSNAAANDDDDDSVTVVPSVKGPPDLRRFYGPNAVHQNINNKTNNTQKDQFTNKSSATSIHTMTAKSRQNYSTSGDDNHHHNKNTTMKSKSQATKMPPARSSTTDKTHQDGKDRDDGRGEEMTSSSGSGTIEMVESPTSKSMAALSQNVSPVHYAPSPQEQHFAISSKMKKNNTKKKNLTTTKTGGRDDLKTSQNKSDAKDDDDSSSDSSSSSLMDHDVKKLSTTTNKNWSKNNNRRIQDRMLSSSTAKDTTTTKTTATKIQQIQEQKKKLPVKPFQEDTSIESQEKNGTSRSNDYDDRTKKHTTTIKMTKTKATKDEIKSRAPKPSLSSSSSSSLSMKNHKSMKDQSSVSNKNERKNDSDSDDDSSNDDEHRDVHPFCKRCVYDLNYAKTGRRPTGGVPKIHHSWCPKNLTSERGETRLRIIQMGRKLNCDGCRKEYTTGKVVTAKGHNLVCRQNSKKIMLRLRKQNEATRHEQNDAVVVATTTKRTSSKGGNNLPGIIPTKRKLDQVEEEDDESSSRGEDDLDSQDEISEYQPAKKSKTIHTIRPTKETGSKQKNAATTTKKAATDKQVKAKSTTLSRSTNTTSTRGQNGVRSNRQNNNAQDADDESDEEDEAIQLKPKWVPVDDNPWGPEGWIFGDVVLFGPEDSGMWHPETALPSPRFVVEPFKAGSNYRITHFTPEEGLSVLSLSRDPMKLRPWGFQVTRDEFGSACLVSSVDVASPASAATLLGIPSTWPDNAPSPHGLNRNDMVLSINGHHIGGMTVETLAVELQSTGANLQLVVSRYKHHEEAAERFAKAEREVLDTMDAASRDERLLGWKEIGNGPVERNHYSKQTHTSLHPSRSTVSFDQDSSKIPHTGPNEKDVADGTQQKTREYAGAIVSEITDKKKKHSQEDRGSTEKSSPTSDDSSNSSLEAVTEGCTCGEIHQDESKEMFWLQCEGCKTWFDVAEECVGFSEEEAANINNWQCDACEPLQTPSSTTTVTIAEDQNSVDKKNETSNVGNKKALNRPDKVETTNKEGRALTRGMSREDSRREDSQKEEAEERIELNDLDRGSLRSPTTRLKAEGWSRKKAWWISPDGKTKILGTTSAIASLDGDQVDDSSDDSVTSPKERLQTEGWTHNHPWWFSPGGKTKKRGISNAIAYLDRTKTNNTAISKTDDRLKTTSAKKEDLVENGWSIRELPKSVFVCSSPGGTKCRGINKAHDRLKLRENNDSITNDTGVRSRMNSRVQVAEKRALEEPSRLSSRIAKKKKKKPQTENASTTKDVSADEEQGQSCNERGFAVGELVHIKHHAWPGMYAYEGAAKIVRAYTDDDGDRLYTVKYIIHKRTIHDIQGQYISREESV